MENKDSQTNAIFNKENKETNTQTQMMTDTNAMSNMNYYIKTKAQKKQMDDYNDDILTNANKKIKSGLPDIITKYKVSNKPPYIVIIKKNEQQNTEQNNSNNTNTYLNRLKIARILSTKLNIKNIVNITNNGKNSIKIILSTQQSANEIIENNDLLNIHGLTAIIPLSCLYKNGIIFGIPIELTEQEILENIKSTIKINKIDRISYKSKDDKITKTERVKLTFEGLEIPKQISLYQAMINVYIYIPKLKQCSNCLLFNHTKYNCKANTTKCFKCGEQHSNENCTNELKCSNCNKDHNAYDKNCQVRKKFNLINEYKHKKICSYKEAKKAFENENYFDLLSNNIDLTEKNFPNIFKNNNINNEMEANKVLRRHRTYAQVTKNSKQIQSIPTKKKWPELKEIIINNEKNNSKPIYENEKYVIVSELEKINQLLMKINSKDHNKDPSINTNIF